MNREALVDRLRRPEGSDAEFKEARSAVPKSAYEAASAFANTGGGTIVFGVRDRDGDIEVVGVDQVDKVQNEFLSTIRSGQKLSRPIDVTADMIEVDGKTLLVFFVPESPRSQKPVYLDGNPARSFIRRGGSNERCSGSELERFLRDAAEDRYDSRRPGRTGGTRVLRSRLCALVQVGLLGSQSRKTPELHGRRVPARVGPSSSNAATVLAPTRAAVLIFGRPRSLRQVLPRPVIDCQFIAVDFGEWSPDRRWADRVVVEENLLQAVAATLGTIRPVRGAALQPRHADAAPATTSPPTSCPSGRPSSTKSSTRTTGTAGAPRPSGSIGGPDGVLESGGRPGFRRRVAGSDSEGGPQSLDRSRLSKNRPERAGGYRRAGHLQELAPPRERSAGDSQRQGPQRVRTNARAGRTAQRGTAALPNAARGFGWTSLTRRCSPSPAVGGGSPLRMPRR